MVQCELENLWNSLRLPIIILREVKNVLYSIPYSTQDSRMEKYHQELEVHYHQYDLIVIPILKI